MPELVAVDTARGWMLMHDSGETLRQSIRPAKDARPWSPVMSRYAEVQIELIERVAEILDMGIPDHRLSLLPSLYTALLTDEDSLMIGQEKGLTTEEFQTLQDKAAR